MKWHNASSLTWEGRKLKTFTKTDGTVISYTYDENGIRTGKKIGSENVEYVLSGSKIIQEKRAGYTLTFLYDTGKLVGFNYKAGSTNADYYYGIDNFGNINYIYDNNGNIVTTYKYDAWGKAISTTGSLASTIGVINPYRYKSYYFDSETQMYYLQSRYYDASVQRFVSPDQIEYLGGSGEIYSCNLYSYCENDPMNNYDCDGHYIRARTDLLDPKTEGQADNTIKKYADIIKKAASYYGVRAEIVAGVIYVEHVTNYNIIDVFGDNLGIIGINMSVGLGQIRMKTAKKIEDSGYIPLNKNGAKWSLTTCNMIYGNSTFNRYRRLINSEINIYYVAAYLKYLQDIWKNYFPEIGNNASILGTLYNTGKEAAHSAPKSNEFGRLVSNYYDHMRDLLYNKPSTGRWFLTRRQLIHASMF